MARNEEDRHLASCQVLGQLFIASDEKGISSTSLLQDIPYSREHMETPSNYIDWESLAHLLDNASLHFTDEEVLQHSMASYSQPLFTVYRLIGQLRFDLHGFYHYLFGTDSVATRFYPLVSEVLTDEPAVRRLGFRITTPAGLRPSLPMSKVLAGQARGIPVALGYDAAEVDATYLPNGLEMYITYPVETGLLPRLRRILRLPFLMPNLARQLQELQDTLVVRNRQLTQETIELRETERALRNQRAQLALVERSAPVMFWLLDLDLSSRYISSSAQSLLGYAETELRNMQLADLLVPDSQRRIREEIESMLSQEGDDSKVEPGPIRLQHKRRDGSIFWSENFLSVSRDSEGRVTGILGITVNIDARVERERREALMEEQMAALSRQELVGNVAGGIAHDLNNYLQTIIGFTELSQLDTEAHHLNRDQLLDHQQQVLHAARSAAELAGQLLAFSKQQTMAMQPMDIATWYDEKRALFRSIVGETITLTHHLEPGLYVMADPMQIERVVINLLINARSAVSGFDPQIRISLAECNRDSLPASLPDPDADYLCLSFEDNGHGIAEADLARVFDPYFTTGTNNSAGLGLAVSAGIVAQHGGQITAAHGENGIGARFDVFLPRTDSQPASPDTAASTEQLSLKGTRILVADDQQQVRNLVASILAGEGALIFEAEDGQRAVDRYKDTPGIDLVIMDVVMPVMSGDGALQHLRAINPRCRVLFMTGYAGNGSIIDTIAEEHVLAKPFTRASLLAAVSQLFD